MNDNESWCQSTICVWSIHISSGSWQLYKLHCYHMVIILIYMHHIFIYAHVHTHTRSPSSTAMYQYKHDWSETNKLMDILQHESLSHEHEIHPGTSKWYTRDAASAVMIFLTLDVCAADHTMNIHKPSQSVATRYKEQLAIVLNQVIAIVIRPMVFIRPWCVGDSFRQWWKNANFLTDSYQHVWLNLRKFIDDNLPSMLTSSSLPLCPVPQTPATLLKVWSCSKNNTVDVYHCVIWSQRSVHRWESPRCKTWINMIIHH